MDNKVPVVSKSLSRNEAIDFQVAASNLKDPPIAIVLQLEVKEDCVDVLIEVMTADAVGSRSEIGCLRFDLLRDKENPNKFTTYEVFKDAAAMDAHKQQAHVKA